jgi:rhodanese-related sulfurtransferase
LIIIPAVAAFATLGASTAQAQAEFQKYPNIADVKFVMEYAAIPKRDDVMIVDSRPMARKYDIGHIPTAVSIPDRKFDEMAGMLPEDKSMQLIFYCGGLKCALSHKSAFKAEKLGYTNIKVYAAGYPDWIKAGNLGSVGAAHVKKLIDKKANVVIIDARPTARKYDFGHVPTAISMPTRKFDELAHMLPADKATPLIFYCGGLKCPLSPKSAAKAVELGYTDVMLFQAGYPAWVEAYGAGPTASKAMPAATMAKAAGAMIETGDESDTITNDSFQRLVSQAPDRVHLIDVRDPEEFAAGSFPTAINMTVDDVEEKVAELPNDKPIIFVCATGARSGEAYDIVKLEREDLEIYFLNATVEYAKDGSFTLQPPG